MKKQVLRRPVLNKTSFEWWVLKRPDCEKSNLSKSKEWRNKFYVEKTNVENISFWKVKFCKIETYWRKKFKDVLKRQVLNTRSFEKASLENAWFWKVNLCKIKSWRNKSWKWGVIKRQAYDFVKRVLKRQNFNMTSLEKIYFEKSTSEEARLWND